MDDLGFDVLLKVPYLQALELVTSELKSEGFGILTKIDVKSTFKEKLGVDFRNYSILGACNPALSHKALSIDPEIGLLLPCSVTVEEINDQESLVRIVNPAVMLNIGNKLQNKDLEQIAVMAKEKLQNAAVALLSRSE